MTFNCWLQITHQNLQSNLTNEFKLSRGEICVANLIPPANGASQGNYFLAEIPKMDVFEAKTG